MAVLKSLKNKKKKKSWNLKQSLRVANNLSAAHRYGNFFKTNDIIFETKYVRDLRRYDSILDVFLWIQLPCYLMCYQRFYFI